MGQSYCGVGGVYALSAVSGGAVHVDSDIVWIQVNFHVVYFRQHRYGCRRSVDTACRFRFRHTLHSVHTALIFQSGICTLALDEHNSFLDAADSGVVDVHQLGLPSVSFCIAHIHSQKILTEQSGFIAAGACSDFQNNVLFIVRVLRQQQNLQFLFVLLNLLFQLVDFHFGQITHFFIAFVLYDVLCISEPFLCFLVLFVFLYDRLHFAHFLDVLLPGRLIVDHIRIRNLQRQFLILFNNKI